MPAPTIVFSAEDVASVVSIAVKQLERRGVKPSLIRDVLLYAGADIARRQNWTPETIANHITEYCKSDKSEKRR
jgi:hypothetical protein